MTVRMSTSLLCLFLLAGCEGCGNDAPEPAATSTQSNAGGENTGEAAGGAAGEGAASGAAAESAPPVLALAVTTGFEGSASLAVENRGPDQVSLSSTLILEREEDGAYAEVSGIAGLALRYDCEGAPPSCLPLIPGAALHPPPWNGMVGDAQCICTRCSAAPTGTYRFVVTSCDGAHRVPSPPFTR